MGRYGQPPMGTVQLTQVVDDTTPPVQRYEPGNPDADKDGYVAYPAINPVSEMVDLMGAVRAYQLNASAVSAAKQMIQQSIDILKIHVRSEWNDEQCKFKWNSQFVYARLVAASGGGSECRGHRTLAMC